MVIRGGGRVRVRVREGETAQELVCKPVYEVCGGGGGGGGGRGGSSPSASQTVRHLKVSNYPGS